MRALLFAALLLLSPAMSPDAALLFELADQSWTMNAEPVESPPLVGGGDDLLVALAFGSAGTRWSTTFHTDAATTWRLALDWELGPTGLLLEIMIDGEPLPPLRDLWRPSPRSQRADLGPRWLGAGEHLLEFIAREEPGGDEPGRVPVQRLILERR